MSKQKKVDDMFGYINVLDKIQKIFNRIQQEINHINERLDKLEKNR